MKRKLILAIGCFLLVITAVVFFMGNNTNYSKVIKKLESNNYEFRYIDLPDMKNVTLINWDEKIYIQKIEKENNKSYYFWDMNYNCEDYGLSIYPLEEHSTLEKDRQYKSYKKWLRKNNLTEKKIIQLLDFYEENSKK